MCVNVRRVFVIIMLFTCSSFYALDKCRPRAFTGTILAVARHCQCSLIAKPRCPWRSIFRQSIVYLRMTFIERTKLPCLMFSIYFACPSLGNTVLVTLLTTSTVNCITFGCSLLCRIIL